MANYGANKIRRFRNGGASITFDSEWGDGTSGSNDSTGPAQALFDRPANLITDGEALYVTDLESGVIRKIDLATSATTTIAGQAYATGIADSTGQLGTTARFSAPNGIATDGTFIYVVDTRSGRVRKLH